MPSRARLALVRHLSTERDRPAAREAGRLTSVATLADGLGTRACSDWRYFAPPLGFGRRSSLDPLEVATMGDGMDEARSLRGRHRRPRDERWRNPLGQRHGTGTWWPDRRTSGRDPPATDVTRGGDTPAAGGSARSGLPTHHQGCAGAVRHQLALVWPLHAPSCPGRWPFPWPILLQPTDSQSAALCGIRRSRRPGGGDAPSPTGQTADSAPARSRARLGVPKPSTSTKSRGRVVRSLSAPL